MITGGCVQGPGICTHGVYPDSSCMLCMTLKQNPNKEPGDARLQADLKERDARYGKFNESARISQRLKNTMMATDGWQSRLNDSQREALEMMANKISRILNGKADYADSWYDLAGYATLVANQLESQVKQP